MKHRVESTAPALLAGLERLLAIDDLMQVEDLEEVLDLASATSPASSPTAPVDLFGELCPYLCLRRGSRRRLRDQHGTMHEYRSSENEHHRRVPRRSGRGA